MLAGVGRGLSKVVRAVQHHHALLAGALASLLVWLWLSVFAPGWVQPWQERITDAIWRLGSYTQDERRLILIDVDERSLREVGPWPWPRAVQAELLNQLQQQGAALQILDIVFADSRMGDDQLQRALAQHSSVLAQVFALPGQGDKTTAGRLAGALDWSNCPVPFSEASGYLGNASSLVASDTRVGHITPRLSSDGVVRHLPAVLCYQGQSYATLGIAALMQAVGDPTLTLRRGTNWFDPAWQIQGARGALPPIPLQQQGDILVPWHQHPSNFISLSAADVLKGKLPVDLLRNAWVLVGSSAFGLHDSVATPHSSAAAGMQVHAQFITAAMDGRIPYTPQAHLLMQALATLAGLGFLATLAYLPGRANARQWSPGATTRTTDARAERASRQRLFPVQWLPLAALAWAVALVSAHAALLWWASWWVGWLPAALAVLAAGVVWGMVEHARSRLDRDRLYTHLSSYLPAPVAAALALQSPSSAIRASTRNVSVLFADIRNFSAYCEARPPEEAAAVLHAFFSTATRVVQAHGGIIEAFQGDAILAVWYGEQVLTDTFDSADELGSLDPLNALDTPGSLNARTGSGATSASPAQQLAQARHTLSQTRTRAHVDATASQLTNETHHAQRALHAAVQLLAAMHGVLPDPAPAGLEPLSLGIGVESGPAMAGSLGLASRRTHMVMGRTVTIASRLVAMTSDLAHPILVGEGLAAQTGAASLQSMGTFLLDGLRVPHHVYAYPVFPAPRL